MSTLPIGMFDSGVGGLTVLKAVSSLLPGENLIYLGDTARLPYGAKSPETIVRYTLGAAGKLVDEGLKLLVVACNTATSAALPILAQRFAPIPVLGVVEPGADAAAAATRSGRIAVIGTEATIAGKAYERAIRVRMPGAIIVTRACPLLVPLAEEGWIDGAEAEAVAMRYLRDIFGDDDNAPDTLLLGCTHFPLFAPLLRTIVGEGVTVVDSAQSTARAVRQTLERKGILNDEGKPGTMRFLTTDNAARFARTGRLFLGRPMTVADVELVNL